MLPKEQGTKGQSREEMAQRYNIFLIFPNINQKDIQGWDLVWGWIVYERKIDEINLAKKSGTSGQADNIF